ncbi:MAG: ATP-binding cassette domain-containing protein [Flavobacteriales bacterium]|nr:ATP-binding cassette domain-containing protein [Flavobacteriales bacterium]
MNPIHPYQRLNRMLAVDRREISHIYLYALVSGLINLTLPLGIQAIINLIMGGQVASSWGVLIGFVTLGVAVAGGLQVMQLALAENIKQKIFARSAFEFAYRMPRIRADVLGGRYLPELVNRFFDINTVQKGLSKVLMDVPIAMLQILLGLLLLAFYHPFFIAFGMLMVTMLYAIFRWSGKRGLETNLKESKYKYEMAYWLEEMGRTSASFKLAGSTTLPIDRTNDLANAYVAARRAHFNVLLGQYGAMVGFKTFVTLVLLLLGGLLVINEQMNIGQFVAAEIVILLVINAVEKLTLSIESIYDVLTALDKIGQVTDLPLERTTGGQAPAQDGKGMAVSMRGIAFRSEWSEQVVLRSIDLDLAPGERLCIAGPSGSGKTTLLQLITGVLDPSEGRVLIDGMPLHGLDLDAMRTQVGDCLTQEDIFTGTVTENITMGREGIGSDDLERVMRITGLLEAASTLPQGLLTRLDPQGSRLPRSLVHRIILSRCLVGSPRLILFEDQLQWLDPATREAVIDHLTAPDLRATVIVVSNDPAVQRRFGRVLVLRDGSLHNA